MDEDRAKRPVETTVTSIRVLEALKTNGGLSLDELTDVMDLARSTIHRHLLTLEEHGLVSRADGTYYVGLRALDFGIHARNRRPEFEATKEQVDTLAEETGEIAWFIARDGDFAIYLYKSGERPLEKHSRLGQRRHLHQLAAGKVILAYLPEDERHDIIRRRGLPTRTGNTVTESETLRAELASIRERGYAVNHRESVEGLNAVAAPIRDEDGYPLSAISISGPARRMDRSVIEDELVNDLLAAIDTIQIQLRYDD
ncbi:MAG: IclR family transcriptional regulator [Salinigranum sp.]